MKRSVGKNKKLTPRQISGELIDLFISECCDAFFQGSNLFFRVALFFSLESYYLFWGVGYETLIAEFLLHTS